VNKSGHCSKRQSVTVVRCDLAVDPGAAWIQVCSVSIGKSLSALSPNPLWARALNEFESNDRFEHWRRRDALRTFERDRQLQCAQPRIDGMDRKTPAPREKEMGIRIMKKFGLAIAVAGGVTAAVIGLAESEGYTVIVNHLGASRSTRHSRRRTCGSAVYPHRLRQPR
jgi:hypothetical protein